MFLGITALGFAVVIFFFVPRLESRLQEQRVEDLQKVAQRYSPELERVIGQEVTGPTLDRLARSVADRSDARVTLLGRQLSARPGAPRFYVITDSNADPRVTPDVDLAAAAVSRGPGKSGSGPLSRRGAHEALVAQPLLFRGRPDWVALYTRDFHDVAATVSLVRDRLLWASLVALLVSVGAGFLFARSIARRVGRLETAARDIAAGRLGAPLPVDSEDELGRLTRTFNDMQRKLARVDRARRDFIANASHELRTPIFSLGGFVELLQDEQLDSETRDEFLQTMREQVDRLQKLAVDLLDLSKLDAGSIDLNPEAVNLGELANAVAAEFRPAVSRHGTELDLQLPDEPVEAVCDRERVAQIMRIFLDNALRHTPHGTHVTLTAGRDNGDARFAVADRGPGVDTANQEQLFERFFTADAVSGSGLGLAIAKELAERMEGRITVRSGEGDTVFTLNLPAAGEEPPV
jgi:signal transduction histidine kinase